MTSENQKYSPYFLGAARIPYQQRGKCLDLYVPYVKCIQSAKMIDRVKGQACVQQGRKFQACKIPVLNKQFGLSIYKMKKNDHARFDAQKVSPTSDTIYNPGLFATRIRSH